MATATKVYVGNLSWNTSEDSLTRTFESCGEVKETKIITDRETGRSRGFAFVTMASPEQAQKVIDTFDGKDLDGRSLKINEAQEKPRTESSGKNYRR